MYGFSGRRSGSSSWRIIFIEITHFNSVGLFNLETIDVILKTSKRIINKINLSLIRKKKIFF